MKKLFIVFVLLILNVFSSTVPEEELQVLWGSWKAQHKKTYQGEEDAKRFAIFVSNYERIRQFNAENEDSKLGLNKFSDLTPEEFRSQYASSGTRGGQTTDNAESTKDVDL